MRLFQFHKTPPPRRRRRKKSNKWINKAKSEVNKMPSLSNLEEDIVIKAAILSNAGHYSLELSDFMFRSAEEGSLVQNIIWAIEALQKKYPRYLQYAKWVAIKEAVNLIEGKRKRNRKKQEDGDHRFVAPEMAPPPDMGKLMQEEWDRHFSGYRKSVQASQVNNLLARFLSELNKMIQSDTGQKKPPNKTEGTIPL